MTFSYEGFDTHCPRCNYPLNVDKDSFTDFLTVKCANTNCFWGMEISNDQLKVIALKMNQIENFLKL